MKKTLLVLGMMASLYGCNKTEKLNLCQRNIYSRNDVDTCFTYAYEVKDGVLDTTKTKLEHVEVYDSLGNCIYSHHNPSSWDMYMIELEAYDDSRQKDYSYRYQYNDTTLTAIVLYDQNGKNMGRHTITKSKKQTIDSIFDEDKGLCFIAEKYVDVKGNDSLEYRYTYKRGKKTLRDSEKSIVRDLGEGQSETVWEYHDHRSGFHYRTITTTKKEKKRDGKIVTTVGTNDDKYEMCDIDSLNSYTKRIEKGHPVYVRYFSHTLYDNGLPRTSITKNESGEVLKAELYKYTFRHKK